MNYIWTACIRFPTGAHTIRSRAAFKHSASCPVGISQ